MFDRCRRATGTSNQRTYVTAHTVSRPLPLPMYSDKARLVRRVIPLRQSSRAGGSGSLAENRLGVDL